MNERRLCGRHPGDPFPLKGIDAPLPHAVCVLPFGHEDTCIFGNEVLQAAVFEIPTTDTKEE